jgi:hypothetical protein
MQCTTQLTGRHISLSRQPHPCYREFLDFLDVEKVRSIDIWTGGALVSPEAVDICDWFIDALQRGRTP